MNLGSPSIRARLGGLPRETRDTLFMLGVIAWTIAPHLLRLQPWVAALALSVLAWRARIAWRDAPLPGRWSLVAVLVLAAGLTWFSERTLLGRDAGVTLLVMLMSLKTLELRARRDALVVFFLGFFLVLTQFLYSQSLWTAITMGLSVWGWLTALTLAHMPAGRPPLREAGRLALRAAAFGTPVMVALFLLFPRVAPLWGVMASTGQTGLSDQMRLGDVAELAQDESVAMRIRFEGPVPPQDTMYFRGPVLSLYDGETWSAEPLIRRAIDPASMEPPKAPALNYELTLEPIRASWVPLLEFSWLAPESIRAVADLTPPYDDSLQWRLRGPLSERVKLKGRAWLQGENPSELPLLRQRDFVRLPPGHHPRTLTWAANLLSQPGMREADATTLVNAVMGHLRSGGYGYTLSPGAYTGDAVDEFWLDRKLGFCEHYASAFVVVMRALDVPARVVTGYQGRDAQAVDGYTIVRQSHAHAWAEYWQAGRGWVRADPTAAIAPDRVERSQQLVPQPGFVMGTLQSVSPGLRLQLRNFFEAIDNRWNQWVLGYGKQEQFKLLDKLGLDAQDGLDLLRALVIGLAAIGLAGAAWAWWDGRRQTPWQRLQSGIRKELATLELDAPMHLSPAALAQRLRQLHGAAAAAVADTLGQLQDARYAVPGEPLNLSRWWRDFRAAVASCRAELHRKARP